MSGRAPLIEATGLSKILCKSLKRSMLYGALGIARELAARPRQSAVLRPGEFRALDDVSFCIREGESLGLVGRNGAGKTTLLRVLSGLMTPDSGRVTIRGRVGALIALGAGFNPLLTGRENIFVNAAILGFGRRETERLFDAIVAFAEVGEFLDSPLHTYSSGMQARLGFAVAAQLEPDILLVDEVLAVGDAGFRNKCYLRINELMARGTAVILVSHQASTLLSVCTTGLLLDRGRVTAFGPIDAVVRSYEENVANEASKSPVVARPKVSTGDLVIDDVQFIGADGAVTEALATGMPGAIRLRIKSTQRFTGINVLIVIRTAAAEGLPVLFLDAARDTTSLLSFEQGSSYVTFEMACVGLRPGNYRAKLHLERSALDMLDVVESVPFRVVSGNSGAGHFHQEGRWSRSAPRFG